MVPDAELVDATMLLARKLARGPRIALALMKQNFNAAENGLSLNFSTSRLGIKSKPAVPMIIGKRREHSWKSALQNSSANDFGWMTKISLSGSPLVSRSLASRALAIDLD